MTQNSSQINNKFIKFVYNVKKAIKLPHKINKKKSNQEKDIIITKEITKYIYFKR